MKILKYLPLFCFILLSFNVQASSCENLFQNEKPVAFYNSKDFIQKHYSKNFNPQILRAGDIRGIFLKDLDFGFSEILAKSISHYFNTKTKVKRPRILIAHDSRIASPAFSDILALQLSEQGWQVTKIGLMPTPVAYYALSKHSHDVALIITASHNSKEYIGFKTVLNPKYNITNIAPEIKKIILENNFEPTHTAKKTKIKEKALAVEKSYIRSLKKEFKNLSFDSFVLDTGNGATGPLAKKTFEVFNLNPHYINNEPNALFPNHAPDPTKTKNLKQLIQKVKETNSEFGIAFDGDGDRIVVIHPDGKIIEADQYAYLFLNELNLSNRTKSIVIDTKISTWFINKAKNMGFSITVTKTGYYFLKEIMKARNAILGLEYSSHIMLNDRKNRGHDDGLYNALRFIELIDKKGLAYVKNRLNEVKNFTTKEFILQNTEKTEKEKLTNKLKEYLKNNKQGYINIDGIRIDRGNKWAVFRFSNTEGLGVITAQAPTEKETLELAQELAEVLEKDFVEK